jgi:hypothetical protein
LGVHGWLLDAGCLIRDAGYSMSCFNRNSVNF